LLGSTIDGRYQVLSLLGEGGMGSVYEARHVGTGRRLALKTITGELARSPSLIQRFELEARAAGAIESQHIAHVLDVGVDRESGTPYLVMEFLVGKTLDQHLTQLRALPSELSLRIAAQACLGLSKAHQAGIAHRDVKPANLFLAERDAGELVAKLLDFGIAKVLLDDAAGKAPVVTQTGHLVGTPLYMSPEQASGDRAVTFSTDIWSLGVMLYEMLSGRTPHHEVRATGRLIVAICTIPAPPLRSVAPWVDERVEAIVMRALDLEPEARFSSAQEMLDAIRPLVSSLALHRDMLVAEQSFVLAAEEGSPESIAARPTAPALPISSDTHVSGDAATVEAQVSTTSAGALTGGASRAQSVPAVRRAGKPALIALAALLAGAIALAASLSARRSEPSSEGATSSPPTSTPSVELAPLVPQEALPGPEATPSGAEERAADAGKGARGPKRASPAAAADPAPTSSASAGASPKNYDPLSEM
jgi:eukaryotic-like serine/threonine-protein kinase